FTGQSRQREVRPVPDEITQRRPALKRQGVEVFLGDEVAQGEVVAAVDGEVVVGDVAVVSQAKLARLPHVIAYARFIDEAHAVDEHRQAQVVQLYAQRRLEQERVGVHRDEA